MKKIELSKYEKELIRLCKGRHRYKRETLAFDLLKKFFFKHYGWDPDEHYRDFLSCMFRNMFNLYMKLREIDFKGSENSDIHEIFSASFEQGFVRDQEQPIERAIMELYGKIQCVQTKERIEGSDKYRILIPIY